MRQNVNFNLYVIGLFFCFYALFQLASLNTLSTFLISAFSANSHFIVHLSSIYLITDAIFLLPAGLILDRVSIKITLPIALMFIVAGVAIVAFSQMQYQVYIGRFISGIGHAFAFLTGFKLARLYFFDKSKMLGFSLVVTFAMIGGLMAQIPFEALINLVGWRPALKIDVIVGIIIIIISLVIVFFSDITIDNNHETKSFNVNLLCALKLPSNYVIGIMIGLLSTPLILLGSTISDLYLTSIIGFSNYHASMISSLIFIGIILGLPLFGWLGTILNKTKILLLLSSIVCLFIGLVLVFIKDANLISYCVLYFFISLFSAVQTLGFNLVDHFSETSYQNTSMAVTNVLIMVVNAIIPISSTIFALHDLMIILPIAFMLAIIALFVISKLRFLPS